MPKYLEIVFIHHENMFLLRLLIRQGLHFGGSLGPLSHLENCQPVASAPDRINLKSTLTWAWELADGAARAIWLLCPAQSTSAADAFCTLDQHLRWQPHLENAPSFPGALLIGVAATLPTRTTPRCRHSRSGTVCLTPKCQQQTTKWQLSVAPLQLCVASTALQTSGQVSHYTFKPGFPTVSQPNDAKLRMEIKLFHSILSILKLWGLWPIKNMHRKIRLS